MTSYPWASLPFFFTSLTIWLFEHFCSCCCNGNPCYFCAFCEICGLLEGLFTFRLWYSCYICSRCFILSNEKFSFAIFAKSVDFWGAFFTSVLNKYELFQNLFFLVLIRYYFVEVFFFLQVRFLLLLRFLGNFETLRGPPFKSFVISLNRMFWWNWYMIQLALSGKRASSSSLPNSWTNWLKKMLALVYNIMNQLCSAIIHWVGATTCNVRSIGSTSEFVAAFVGTLYF